MATKLITIPTLLVGTQYKSLSRFIEGTITHAEKRDLWYGENIEAYLITVRPKHGSDFMATVAVKTN
jgi:hypothetical protein